MDSSLIDNLNTSVIADAIDVNGGQSPNTLSIGINGSASCLVFSDERDVSFSDSINHSDLKRKYGWEIGNRKRQFWKAGDYEIMLEFIQNFYIQMQKAISGLCEACNGATYINIDMLINERDGSRMLLIEGNTTVVGCAQIKCLSLGYSSKRKMPNTIDGNEFKTSTTRFGVDCLIFSRCNGSDQGGDTEKEDIVVPMSKMMCFEDNWNRNLKITSNYCLELEEKSNYCLERMVSSYYLELEETSNYCFINFESRMLTKFQHEQEGASVILCDNKATISMTKNPIFHSRTKHINIHFYFIRDLVEKEEVYLSYCSTHEQ
uniref:Retrovirus-related Pol polyprotein from transposon TNT 1-94 n=1 Tax=Cucumis melo TaxID=3656 RepID=A0A9I9DFY2_CUCME